MTRLTGIVCSAGLIVTLAGCGAPSSDEVVADAASTWGDQDIDALLDLTYADQVDANQRAAIADTMSAREPEEDSEVDISGGVSDQARVWGLVVTCSGTRSLVAGSIDNTSTDERWTIAPEFRPGGEHADFVPGSLPAELRTLPKAGT